ncbi:MAG: hypothetical protein AABY22_10155 [Nanoarchaeota archaeon]
MLQIEKTITKFGYNPNELKNGSNKKCVCSCDYCGIEIEKIYYKYLLSRKLVAKDSCKKEECRLQKQKENNIIKIGVEHHSQTQQYKDKYKKTCLERYGVENPFYDKEKIKKSIQQKFGVDNVAYLPETKIKRIETNLQKYGTKFPLQNKEIREKGQNTTKEKYGYKFYAQTEEFKNKFSEQNRLSYEEILERCKIKNYEPMFLYEEYDRSKNKLKFKCLIHECFFESSIFLISFEEKNQCPECKLNGVSKYEKEIGQFLAENKIIFCSNVRDVIKPYELDINIPDKKTAIEFHGLVWHSQKFNEDNRLHYKKFLMCKELNIKLFQFYEDEWLNKKNICKSMILNELNISSKKLNARDLLFKEDIDINVCNNFLNQNHLMGVYNGLAKTFCLTNDDNEIVCCFLVRSLFAKQREENKKSLEIVRFGVKTNLNIRGGFSRLMKHTINWAQKQNYKNIITYSDCRYSEGDVYNKNGFSFKKEISPNYFYTDFYNRYPKYQFRAKNGKPESEIVSEFGLYKIYDAGKYCWELNLQ